MNWRKLWQTESLQNRKCSHWEIANMCWMYHRALYISRQNLKTVLGGTVKGQASTRDCFDSWDRSKYPGGFQNKWSENHDWKWSKKGNGFRDLNTYAQGCNGYLSAENRIKYLEMQLAYKDQEIEFLKNCIFKSGGSGIMKIPAHAKYQIIYDTMQKTIIYWM